MFYNTFRVVFTNATGQSLCLWVEARNSRTAIVEATMLIMGGTGNDNAREIHSWIISGNSYNVDAAVETN